MRCKHLIGGLLAVALVFSGIFCVTFSTVTQSIPLVLFSLAAVIVVLSCKKPVSGGNLGLKVLVIVTCIYFLIRAYFSPVIDLARQDMFLISSAAMIYSIMGILMPSKIIRTWLVRAFLAVMILNLLNWIPAVDQWRDSTLNFASGERNTGLFNHRNFYGNFMFMMTCLCLSFALFTTGNGKVRLGFFLLAVLGGVSTVLSTSRASFLSLAVGLCVIIACWMTVQYFSSGKKNKKRQMILVIALVCAVLGGLVIGGKHLLSERDTGMADSNGRKAYFAVSIEQIPDAPMIGSGSRSIEYKSYEYWPMSMSRNTEDFKFVHNEYIQAITDYGLIGCVLLVSILFWHIVNGVVLLFKQLEMKETKNTVYVVAGLSIMLGLSINMLFSFPLHGFVNLLLIVFATAMLLGESSETKRCKVSGIGSKILFFATVITLTLFITYNFTEGRKELMAGSSFWKEKIISDDLHWKVEDSSRVNWEKALKGANSHSPTFERCDRLGQILCSKGQFEEAIEYYELSKQRHPYSAVSRINLARILAAKGDFKEAQQEYIEVEYLVKNREPLFNHYKNLAEFYLAWANKDASLRSENLTKARAACEKSIKKSQGYIYPELRKTMAGVLLSSYYDLMEKTEYDEAYKVFDELVILCRGYVVKNHEDAKFILSHAQELLKHAQYTWSKGQLERAAKATFRAKAQYHRYYGAMKGKVDQSWIDEDKQIDEALSIFIQAGVKIDKK